MSIFWVYVSQNSSLNGEDAIEYLVAPHFEVSLPVSYTLAFYHH